MDVDATPFLQGRKVVAAAQVSVPHQVVLTYDNDVLGADIISDIVRKPLQHTTPDGEQLGTVHVFMANPDHAVSLNADCFFMVDVEGVAEHRDLWIKGEFRWKVRNYYESLAPLAEPPTMPVSTTWLRGNGRLASFLVPHTRSFWGRVTVYGPPAPPPPPAPPAPRAPPVHPDFSSLRPLADLCDVVLRAADSDFPVHRNVLAARSPVFRAMFTGDFKEAKDTVIVIIVDCSAEVFGVFVDFLYSGTLGGLGLGTGELLHLLELADRFLVAELKDDCARQLAAVGADDALEVFQAALEKPFVPLEVRESVGSFIRNNWPAVCGVDSWTAFCEAQPIAAMTMQALMASDDS